MVAWNQKLGSANWVTYLTPDSKAKCGPTFSFPVLLSVYELILTLT